MTDFIQVIDGALSPQFCRQLIEVFQQSPHRKVGTTSGGVDLEKKRSTDLYLNNHQEYQHLVQQLSQVTSQYVVDYFREHLFALIGAFGLTVYHPTTKQPVKLTEQNFDEVALPQLAILVQQLFRIGPMQAQHYVAEQGGYPYWHSEVYPQQPHNEALHRVLLFMFYLNDVEHGGETEFYYQQRKISPKAGTMVIAPAYFTHTHRGNIPISHDKFIVTSWILFQRAEQLYGERR